MFTMLPIGVCGAAAKGSFGAASMPIPRTLQMGGALMSGTSIGQGISGKDMWTGEDLSLSDRASHLTFGALGTGLDLAGAGLNPKNLSDGFPTVSKALEGVSPQNAPFGRRLGPQAGAVRLGSDEGIAQPKVSNTKKRLFAELSIEGDATMKAGTGETDPYGNITYSTAGTPEEQALVLNHERVHQFFSPKFKVLRDFRANLGMTAYQKSTFIRYLEEALAESYAQLKVNGLKGLPEGIKFPVKEDYVELKQVITEGVLGTVTVGGVTYGVYVVSDEEKR